MSERENKLLEDFNLTIEEFNKIVCTVFSRTCEIPNTFGINPSTLVLSKKIEDHGYSSLNRLTDIYQKILDENKYTEKIIDCFYFLVDTGFYEIYHENGRFIFLFKGNLLNFATAIAEITKVSERHKLETEIENIIYSKGGNTYLTLKITRK